MKKKSLKIVTFCTIVMLVLLTSMSAFAANNNEIIAKVSVEGYFDYVQAYQVLNMVNEQRRANGLNTLQMDKDLLDTAMQRAAEISIVFESDHRRPDNTECFTAFPQKLSWAGENIAYGYPSASSVMNGWMNSTGHRENILNYNYNCVGIGCAKIDGRLYWVQCFGTTWGCNPTVPSTRPANYTGKKQVNVAYSNLHIENIFSDIKTSDWYYESVKYSFATGMIYGNTETTFNPKGNLTRGMLVTILHRMEGFPTANGKNFSDVKQGQYYYDAVRWAAGAKVVNGYDNGKFGPNDNITREQLAAILMNYAQYKRKNVSARADLNKFGDNKKIASYFKDSVSWAVANKIISGKDNGKNVDPKGTATRAEVAAMLSNYCSYIGK